MKFLVIVQDLRISGTSEGIVSRSFLGKLRRAYPEAVIEVLYLKIQSSDDQLELLPVNAIETHVIPYQVPFYIEWWNKLYWRLFHVSLTGTYYVKQFSKYISQKNPDDYDHIFVRSSGLEFETILALDGLPILKKAIINFHDPYPVFWNSGSKKVLTNLELFKLKQMLPVVSNCKLCISPSHLLSLDLHFLYGSSQPFYVLPHQYDSTVFDFSTCLTTVQTVDKVVLSYHGAIQFGRNPDVLLDAYVALLEKEPLLQKQTEMVFRLRGSHNVRLKTKYASVPNIKILDSLHFVPSSQEQDLQHSILIILEDCFTHSNILVGKAPFLASLQKPILSISPLRSEVRNLVVDEKYVATFTNQDEIELKMRNLIEDCLRGNMKQAPFGDYFSEANFKIMLDSILNYN